MARGKHLRARPDREALRTDLAEGVSAEILVGGLSKGPLFTAFMAMLGASSTMLGLAMGIPVIAGLFQLVIPFYFNGENRKRGFVRFAIVQRILLVSLAGVLWLPQEWRVPTILAILGLSFISGSVSNITWNSLIYEVVPEGIRGPYFGIRNALIRAISGTAILFGGFLIHANPGPRGFVWLFAIAAVILVFNSLFLLRFPNPPSESTSSPKMAMLKKPLRDRRFIKATLILGIAFFAEALVIPLFPYFMLHTVKIDTGMVSVITAMQMFAVTISCISWGYLSKQRFSPRSLLLWQPLILGCACFMWSGIGAFPVVPVLIALHLVSGIGKAGILVLVPNFVNAYPSKSERSIYVSVFMAIRGVFTFAGSVMGGWLYGYMNLGVILLAGGILVGISLLQLILPFLYKLRHYKPRHAKKK